MISLHIFNKLWRRIRRRIIRRVDTSSNPGRQYMDFSQETTKITRPSGLNKEVIESLPIFTYTGDLSVGEGDEKEKEKKVKEDCINECSVCLSEFQENEECRLLPRCRHSFHTRCIDTWFLSNSTCPLCRMNANPFSSSENDKTSRFNSTTTFHGDNDRSRLSLEASFLSNSRRHQHEPNSRFDTIFHDDDSNESNLGHTTWVSIRDGEGSRRPILSYSVPSTRDRVQFPANVLFWGNDFQVNSCLDLEHVIVNISQPQISSSITFGCSSPMSIQPYTRYFANT